MTSVPVIRWGLIPIAATECIAARLPLPPPSRGESGRRAWAEKAPRVRMTDVGMGVARMESLPSDPHELLQGTAEKEAGKRENQGHSFRLERVWPSSRTRAS